MENIDKVQIRWLGHAGFKITIPDPVEARITRNIYIDVWIDAPTGPEDIKNSIPDDADLILVTHGHYDHAISAPPL